MIAYDVPILLEVKKVVEKEPGKTVVYSLADLMTEEGELSKIKTNMKNKMISGLKQVFDNIFWQYIFTNLKGNKENYDFSISDFSGDVLPLYFDYNINFDGVCDKPFFDDLAINIIENDNTKYICITLVILITHSDYCISPTMINTFNEECSKLINTYKQFWFNYTKNLKGVTYKDGKTLLEKDGFINFVKILPPKQLDSKSSIVFQDHTNVSCNVGTVYRYNNTFTNTFLIDAIYKTNSFNEPFIPRVLFEDMHVRTSIKLCTNNFKSLSLDNLKKINKTNKTVIRNVLKEGKRILNKVDKPFYTCTPGIFIIKEDEDWYTTNKSLEYLVECLYRKKWLKTNQILKLGSSVMILSKFQLLPEFKHKEYYVSAAIPKYYLPSSNLFLQIDSTQNSSDVVIEDDNNNPDEAYAYNEEELNALLDAICSEVHLGIFIITNSDKTAEILENTINSHESGRYAINLVSKDSIEEQQEENLIKKSKYDYVKGFMKTNGFKKFTYVDPGKIEDINLEDLGKFTLNYNNMYKYNAKLVNRNSNIAKKNESPNKTLKSMIGLSQIKETINDIINVITLKKTLIKKKVPLEQPCMHMVFYGNPGTAKTTVARLVAKILKKKGILSTGVFKEVGRQDLVGKYVGWTAPTVERAIKSARGGILFIDEAYSLCEGKEGLYGDEAINTLIQQMELVKSHTIIILAGYPDEMEKLLDTNPGFRSRIAFHVKFPNYSKEELIDILKLMASKQQFTLSNDYLEEVEKQLPKHMTAKDFGNGRFMRSLLEQSIMKLSSRLTKNNEGKELNDLSIKELTTLTKEDVAFDQLIKSDKTIGIGFNV